jgi:hypothetical protein
LAVQRNLAGGPIVYDEDARSQREHFIEVA